MGTLATIQRKLLATASLITLLLLGAGVIGFLASSVLVGHVRGLQLYFPAIKNHLEADMMHDAVRSDVLVSTQAKQEGNAAQRDKAAADFQAHAERMREAMTSNRRLPLEAAVASSVGEAERALEDYLAKAAAVLAADVADRPALEARQQAFTVSFEALEKQMETLSDAFEGEVKKAAEQGDEAAARAQFLMVVGPLLGALVLGVILLMVTRSVVRRLEGFGAGMDLVGARGDLTCRVPAGGNDEISRTVTVFNGFVDRLQQAMGQCRAAADAMTDGSARLASRSRQIRERVAHQSEQATQASVAVDELQASISEVSSDSAHMAQAASRAASVARSGFAEMETTSGVMQSMSESVQISATRVSDLNTAVARIGHVAVVIKEIADQTNLLALNAAIEAARAGEQGRGFAVVADEVRKLAERTAQSTSEIAETVATVIEATAVSVRAMEQASAGVSQSLDHLGRTRSGLQEIVTMASSVADKLDHIAAAAAEQKAAVETVARMVESVAADTEGTNSALAEVDDTGVQLSRQAQDLLGQLTRFRIS